MTYKTLAAMLLALSLSTDTQDTETVPMAQTYVQLRSMLTMKCSAYLPSNPDSHPPDDAVDSDLDTCISAGVSEVFALNGWQLHDDWQKYARGIHAAIKAWIEAQL